YVQRRGLPCHGGVVFGWVGRSLELRDRPRGPHTAPMAGSDPGVGIYLGFALDACGSHACNLAFIGMRRCAKMNCDQPPSATVTLSYGSREVLVDDLLGEPDPNLLDLCPTHVSRMTPPIGWSLHDRRSLVSTG